MLVSTSVNTCRGVSTPIIVDRPKNHNLYHPASLLPPVPRLLRLCIHLPVSTSPLYPLSCISTTMIIYFPYPPPTLYAIPVTPHLCHTSVVITLCLCCSTHRIVFHLPVFYSAIVCLHGSCVAAVSSVASISIIPKYLPQHRPRLTRHILCHCHCSPAISATAIVAPAVIVIIYFITTTLHCMLSLARVSPIASPMCYQRHSPSCAL